MPFSTKYQEKNKSLTFRQAFAVYCSFFYKYQCRIPVSGMLYHRHFLIQNPVRTVLTHGIIVRKNQLFKILR